MSRKNADRGVTVTECLIVAALVCGLVVTGVAALSFGIQDLFAGARIP